MCEPFCRSKYQPCRSNTFASFLATRYGKVAHLNGNRNNFARPGAFWLVLTFQPAFNGLLNIFEGLFSRLSLRMASGQSWHAGDDESILALFKNNV
jgi:hypothetical protein